jgi:hypothetical protein
MSCKQARLWGQPSLQCSMWVRHSHRQRVGVLVTVQWRCGDPCPRMGTVGLGRSHGPSETVFVMSCWPSGGGSCFHSFYGVIHRDERHCPGRFGLRIGNYIVVFGDSVITGRRCRGGRNVSPRLIRSGSCGDFGHAMFRAIMIHLIGMSAAITCLQLTVMGSDVHRWQYMTGFALIGFC